jgi:hypothetical protein
MLPIIEAKVPAFARVLSERHGAENWKKVLSRTADMMMEMGDKSPLMLTDYQTIKRLVAYCWQNLMKWFLKKKR